MHPWYFIKKFLPFINKEGKAEGFEFNQVLTSAWRIKVDNYFIAVGCFNRHSWNTKSEAKTALRQHIHYKGWEQKEIDRLICQGRIKFVKFREVDHES